MKFRFLYLVFCVVLPVAISAKEPVLANTLNNASVQIIQNKGQITDQHGAVRRDIDFKIVNNGVSCLAGMGSCITSGRRQLAVSSWQLTIQRRQLAVRS